MAIRHENGIEPLPGDLYGFGMMEHGDVILVTTRIERDRVRAAFHKWKVRNSSARYVTTRKMDKGYRIELRDPAKVTP